MKTSVLFSAIAAALLASGPAAPALAQGGKPDLYAVQPVTADDIVGHWGDNGDCGKGVIFYADGTFESYTGGGGNWTLNGDRLVLNGPGGTFEMQIRWGDSGQLLITNPDGSVGTSQRC